MIEQLIRWSVRNRFLVLLAAVFIAAWGIWALKTTPVDALPDLSDVQVILRTSFPGQAPQIVEGKLRRPPHQPVHPQPPVGELVRRQLLVVVVIRIGRAIALEPRRQIGLGVFWGQRPPATDQTLGKPGRACGAVSRSSA